MNALTRLGSVWVRGVGFLGQLGLDNRYANAIEFKRMPSLQKQIIKEVKASWAQSAVLLDDGRVILWGWPLDARSQMQVTWLYKDHTTLSKFIQRYSPLPKISMREGTEVPEEQQGFIGKVTALDYGGAFMAALDETGKAYTWGMNHRGQLGLGHYNYVSSPAAVLELIEERIINVATGYQHVLFQNDQGKVWGAGRAEYSQFGTVPSDRLSPYVSIANLFPVPVHNIAKIAAGQNHSLFLTEEGDVLSLGKNGQGQCGQSSFNAIVETPARVYLPEPAVAIACGFKHSLVLGKSGSVYGFGSKLFGQLDSIKGRGDTEQCSPMKIPLPTSGKVVRIIANFERSAAITDTGECWVWGGEDLSHVGGENYEGFTLMNEELPEDSGEGIMDVGLGYMHTIV
eukprot:CAMPEP_0204915602 /NCGR_PEP_ID=MMETSP1397-20131031/13573_1 /ASSEMBLY_ACC=CAM_ASM_000891 /TAXON_ID=49980 /ORGANISM="Climacostomum Climacostomum virens, Strain Stock W-24" /LENGTH=398 /DNA_ID=CAMNT_0052087717 /DNA_START=36 /DNA_END=1228 /DNA_ORIENTATION=-